MQLIIRLKDGVPFEHPILLDNFIQAFPEVDIDDLPEQFAWFDRVEPPKLGPYEVYVGVEYKMVGNGRFGDVHQVRNMTPEEKAQRQADVKAAWADMPFKSWVFNEEKCQFEAPTPKPEDGEFYEWSEEQLAWVKVSV
jgi:hypothetical protein